MSPVFRTRTFNCYLDGQPLCLESLLLGSDNPQAPILLALHGWLDNAISFVPLSEYLQNYQIIALDLPGHGHSQHLPAGCDYAIWQSLPLLLQVLEQIEQPVHLVGHSMGGNIATLLAAAFTEKIKSLTLIDALGALVTAETQCSKQLAQGVKDALKPISDSKVYPDLSLAMSARLKITPFFDAQSLAPIVARNMSTTDNGYVWRIDPRLRRASKVRFSEAQVQAILGDIDCPTLLIKASHSFISDELFSVRKDKIKQLEIRCIQGYHHLHYLSATCASVAATLEAHLTTLINQQG